MVGFMMNPLTLCIYVVTLYDLR